MSVAVVFDSAGTLLFTRRVAKDVLKGEILPEIESTILTFSSPDRVLVVLHATTRDFIDADPEKNLSEYLKEHSIGFGISCTRRVITSDEVAEILYNDGTAKLGDVQECIRDVWDAVKNEPILSLNTGVILNVMIPGIEFTITTGGVPFEGARDTITDLHKMGVPTYIASGDRLEKLERMADHLGIPRDRVYGIATPLMKAKIVEDLKEQYNTVVMVGDSVNDIYALRKADVAILTLQQTGERPLELIKAANYKVKSIREVLTIVKKLDNLS